MLTVKQAAVRLGISPSLVYGWCEDRILPHFRLGNKGSRRGKILIEETALDAFLQCRKVEAGAGNAASLALRHITLH
jgi:excisionase family DNA binding protein